MNEETDIKGLLAEAWVKRREEKYDQARHLVKKAEEFCKADDYYSLGRIFHLYMQFESDQNDPIKALELCKQSLSYYKKSEDLQKIAHSTRHVADLERHLGHNSESECNYREAIDIYKSNPDTSKIDLANALRGFGLLLEKCKKVEEAITVWKETKELYQACNLQAGINEANQKLLSLE